MALFASDRILLGRALRDCPRTANTGPNLLFSECKQPKPAKVSTVQQKPTNPPKEAPRYTKQKRTVEKSACGIRPTRSVQTTQLSGRAQPIWTTEKYTKQVVRSLSRTLDYVTMEARKQMKRPEMVNGQIHLLFFNIKQPGIFLFLTNASRDGVRCVLMWGSGALHHS